MQARRSIRLAAVAASLAALSAPAAAQAATPQQVGQAVRAGGDWLRSQQDPTTGGFVGFGGDFAVSAMVAAKAHAADVSAGGPTLQDSVYAEIAATAYSEPIDPATDSNSEFMSVNELAKWTLFSAAAGIDPQRATEQGNLVAQLAATYKPATGQFGAGLTNTHGFALMALNRADGAPPAVTAKAVEYLSAQQHDDGGFNYGVVQTPAQRAAESDADMTGAIAGALCDSGVPTSDPRVRRALRFLQGRLQPSGAILAGPFVAPENASTNAWALNGLNACGVDPQGLGWTSSAGNTPVDFLLSLQRTSGPDAGAIKYEASESDTDSPNFYSHQDALRALGGELYSATVPQRAGAGPRFRANATPAAGTATPHAIAVDDGQGDVRFCRVSFPVGASLAEVLTAAQAGTAPAGCVESFAATDGTVTTVNGDTGNWRLSLAGRPEAAASAATTVGFGDVVSLRRNAPGGAPEGPPGPPGQDGDDGAPGQDGGDGAPGQDGATGADGAPGQDGAQGPAGSDGQAGATGAQGPAGATGAQGPAGARGPRGRTPQVRCVQVRRSGRLTRTIRCAAIASSARATLRSRGRIVARGPARRLVRRAAAKRGSYLLRIRTATVRIRVR